MKSTLQRYFQGWELQVDRGARPIGVLVAVLAIAMLAISPAAGALVDDTRAPQQQTPLPDGNTTTTTTPAANATTTDSGTAESSDNSTNESNNSSSEVSFRFPDQTTNGTRIVVEAPRLPNGGFLVVHGSSFPNNGIGSTIGVSEYIAPNSSYSGVEIRLFDVPGRTYEEHRLKSPTTFYVRAALDTNDNQQYDHLTTDGAQDVGYVVDGRQAVLSAQIEVNQSDISSSPAEQYGLDDDGTGSGGSGGAQSDSQAGTESNSGSGSGSGSEGNSENMSDIISGGSGDANPIGAGGSGSSSSSNGSGSGSDDTSSLLSVGAQISQLGPLLALVGGVGLLIYLRQRA